MPPGTSSVQISNSFSNAMVLPSGLIDANCTPSFLKDVTGAAAPPEGAIFHTLKNPSRSDTKYLPVGAPHGVDVLHVGLDRLAVGVGDPGEGLGLQVLH